jgi:CDP-diacylglycerol---glycerol-3-phosphate 3-phosphatidyltransferase
MNEKTAKAPGAGFLYRNILPYVEKIPGFVRFIPAWVPANLITGMRGILFIPIYLTYEANATGWVVFLFVLAVLTDTVDGVHARYRNQVSNLGKILDPVADKILIVGTLFLVAPGRFSPYIIWVIVGLELVLVALAAVIGPAFTRFFNIRRKLGSNIFGKIKFPLEGLSLAVLLVGIDNRALQQVSEGVMWCAAFFALLSIIRHVFSTEEG